MRFKDQVYFVRENMKKNKMRIFMTVLATAMGTAFLIVLASVAFGLHGTLIKEILQQETINQVNIYGKEDAEGSGITDQDITYFESLDNVRAVKKSNRLDQAPQVVINDYAATADVVAVDFEALEKGGTTLQSGRYPRAANEVVVGVDFDQTLVEIGADDNAIYDEENERRATSYYQGKLVDQTLTMTIERQIDPDTFEEKAFPLTIVGVKEEPAEEWQRDQSVTISYALLQQFSDYTQTQNAALYPPDENMTFSYQEIALQSDNLEHVTALSETLNDEGYFAYSVAAELKQINLLFTIAKAGLVFIGTIAIIIASIGIFNTMTMAVTERAPDIGIMKAIGASPKTIKQIFLLESSFIGILGALIGTAVSYLISMLVNVGLPLILGTVFEDTVPEGFKFSSIPPSLVLIAFLICLIVTLVSGSRPAKKATRIDVLSALRREL
ncbi:acetoin utilization transport system permease protein [Streptohalobacillus salinus]|uniref:Acetoin utilization transport system permease protein n=1 Tax=Streptohalobacillus salinus TaxID=621096 RepID=A0A2V3W4C4_9BACI|nr:ABC transporter permease [Streptohalobacillus salinus]PXW89183.1 acetoin utilization transport system permease protein [Streptohalobacillus salinus]